MNFPEINSLNLREVKIAIARAEASRPTVGLSFIPGLNARLVALYDRKRRLLHTEREIKRLNEILRRPGKRNL